MILFFGLLSCTEKPFVFKKIPNQCKQLSSVYKQEKDGILSEVMLKYEWDEAKSRLDFQTQDHKGQIHDNYHVYNEQGFVVEKYIENFSFDQIHDTIEYDCSEDFCWEQKTLSGITSGATTSTVTTEYEWDGKTRKHTIDIGTRNVSLPFEKGKGYTIYNDYGEPVKEYSKFMYGYQEASSEYDCRDGWCKLTSQTREYVTKPINPLMLPARNFHEFEQNVSFWWKNEPTLRADNYEYDWDENKQEWKTSTSESYRLYNDYGYVIEEYHESPSFKSWTINTYNCGEE